MRFVVLGATFANGTYFFSGSEAKVIVDEVISDRLKFRNSDRRLRQSKSFFAGGISVGLYQDDEKLYHVCQPTPEQEQEATILLFTACEGTLDTASTTAQVQEIWQIEEGTAFLAIVTPGQQVIFNTSEKRIFFSNKNGILEESWRKVSRQGNIVWLSEIKRSKL